MQTYTCPLTCEERMSIDALSGHLRVHAGYLADRQRDLYRRLGIPRGHADECEREILWRMARRFHDATRWWPRWDGIEGPVPRTAWVDPECGCERSPDVPVSVPCPAHSVV